MNILVIIGSPKAKMSNSEAIGNYLIEKLDKEGVNTEKFFLYNELMSDSELIRYINNADKIVFSLPVYENTVPGLVLRCFEVIRNNKEILVQRNREMMAIVNSGLPEVKACSGAIETCMFFAKEMEFHWICGIPVAPGTLIDGKNLNETRNTYKRLIIMLDIIAKNICFNKDIIVKECKLVSKPFINPLIYRLVGRLLQESVIKKLGKERYYAKPMINKVSEKACSGQAFL